MNELNEYSLFTGSEQCYILPYAKSARYTEGVQHMAKNENMYWFLEEVIWAAKRWDLQEGQFTLLREEPGKTKFRIEITDLDNNQIAEIKILFSDCRFDAARLWFIDGIILLPSEY